mgnify:CR=1 FL=1
MDTIYLDHAATTAMEPEAVEAMLPYFRQFYGNPSAAYRMATESKKVLHKTRQMIAGTLQILPEEVFLLPEEQRVTIGRFWEPPVILERVILLPVGLNIRQYWKPVDTWSIMGLR